jgi:hypothetical protein
MRITCWKTKTTDTHSEYFFFHDAGDPKAPGPPHYRGFTITLRHTTLGRTPLDELSARRRDLYLTTHTLARDRYPCPRWNSNLQSQQASGHILKHSIARPLGSVRICVIYRFSTSVTVTRTHLNATVYVHRLFCLPDTFHNTRLFTKRSAHYPQ